VRSAAKHKYVTSIPDDQVVDLSNDPKDTYNKALDAAGGSFWHHQDFHKAILDNGYSGYFNSNSGLPNAVALLKPQPVKYIGKDPKGHKNTSFGDEYFTEFEKDWPKPDKPNTNESVVNSIVDRLLSEVTLIKSYKAGNISGSDIKAASDARREASRRFGQKIPVISGKNENTNNATRVSDVLHKSSTVIFEPESPTEHLGVKLSRSKPHVVVGATKYFLPSVTHELGHIIDKVQNEPDHVTRDNLGRNRGIFDPPGRDYDDVDNVNGAVIKSEGRAWRVGRDLQKSVGAFNLDQEAEWKSFARKNLNDYLDYHLR
jgi:hypothetical protein